MTQMYMLLKKLKFLTQKRPRSNFKLRTDKQGAKLTTASVVTILDFIGAHCERAQPKDDDKPMRISMPARLKKKASTRRESVWDENGWVG